MATKRVIVWVGSTLFGLGASALIIVAFGTTFEKFVYAMNVPLIPSLNGWLLFLSLAFLAFIWLDLLFKTNYLKK